MSELVGAGRRERKVIKIDWGHLGGSQLAAGDWKIIGGVRAGNNF